MKILYSDIENLSIEEVNILFRTLFRLALPQINNLLNDGIRLPLIEPFFNLSSSALTLLDRYMRLDFNPVPIAKGMERLVALLFQHLTRSYSKLAIRRQLRLAQPTTLPKWLKIEY